MTAMVTDAEAKRAAPTSARRVVALLLATSTIIGFFAYWRFTASERFLSQAVQSVAARGSQRSPEACVDEVLSFSKSCEAMKSLCDASTARVMDACLAGRDRSAYCQSLGDQPKATSFGFAECKARGVNRSTKKACANAYRAIAAHCARGEGK